MGGMSSEQSGWNYIWDCVSIKMDKELKGLVDEKDITDQYAFTNVYHIPSVLEAKENDNIPHDLVTQ